MLPDIDLRLQAMTKTLQDIVLPAVPEAEQQAREQVMLIIGNLGILGAQWKVALKFELGTYDGLCRLAGDARALVDDATLRGELDAALVTAGKLDRTDYDLVSHEVKRIGGVLDRIISGDYTTVPIKRELFEKVREYGHHEAWRYRVWFAASQVDPDAAALPGIAALLK